MRPRIRPERLPTCVTRAACNLEEIAEAVTLLADNRYTDALVDLMYVETNTEAQLQWVQRLLAATR